MTLFTQPVAENLDKYWNVFQYVYNDKAYGGDAAKYLFDAGKQMGWKAPNKKIAIIKVDYALAVADRIFLLKKGEVVMERVAGEIEKSEIEKAYF